MKQTLVGTGVLLACLLGVVPQAGASFGGAGFGGGAGGAVQPTPPATGGMIGMGGACGHFGIGGMHGFSGCVGSFPCSFGGCFGGHPHNPYCFGSMSGCFGGFGQPTQTYSKWNPSPGKAYYHRTLTIQTPPPNEAVLEFVLVHYPDRPKFFYFYDPVDRKYFGRYRLGVAATDCFHILNFNDRKASLNDIKEVAYRSAGAMPSIPLVSRPKPGATMDAGLKNLKLMRPPESIPNELLGLPPEEPSLKKAIPKK